jgi:hypothetical protein
MKTLLISIAVVLLIASTSEAQCRYIYVNNQPVWVCDYNPPQPQQTMQYHQPQLNTNGIDITQGMNQAMDMRLKMEMLKQLQRQNTGY